MQPEDEWIGVCGVDAGGGGVCPQQLTAGVLDEFLRVAATQALGCVLVDRGDVVAFRCADDSAERGARAQRLRRLVIPVSPNPIHSACQDTRTLILRSSFFADYSTYNQA